LENSASLQTRFDSFTSCENPSKMPLLRSG